MNGCNKIFSFLQTIIRSFIKNRVGSFLETENSSTPNNEIEKNYFGNFITIACWLWRFASLNLTNVDSASSWDVSKITSPPE